MIPIIEIWVASLLLIASLLDIRSREIPSFFLTAGIFVIFMFQIALGNIETAIIYGVFVGISALLLIEMDFMRGMADVKAMILVGLSLLTPESSVIFIISVLFLGIFYKLFWKWKIGDNELPFLPVIFFSYLLTIALVLL